MSCSQSSVNRVRSEFAHRGVDDFGVEGRVVVGDVGVELHARFRAVPRIHLASELTAAPGFEVLAVRRGGSAFAPPQSEGLAVLRVDHLGQRRRIGFISDVPGLQPREVVGRVVIPAFGPGAD